MVRKTIKTCVSKLPVKSKAICIIYDKRWTILKVTDNSGGVYCGV